MDCPARAPMPIPVSEALSDALGKAPSEVHLSRDILAVYDDEASVRNLSPGGQIIVETLADVLKITTIVVKLRTSVFEMTKQAIELMFNSYKRRLLC